MLEMKETKERDQTPTSSAKPSLLAISVGNMNLARHAHVNSVILRSNRPTRVRYAKVEMNVQVVAAKKTFLRYLKKTLDSGVFGR